MTRIGSIGTHSDLDLVLDVHVDLDNPMLGNLGHVRHMEILFSSMLCVSVHVQVYVQVHAHAA